MDAEWKKTLEDGTEIVRTCAWSPPGCHPVGCGLKLHVKDGKLIKVEGDPEHPVTKGRLCVRCLSLKDYIYHEDRIIYPMKRAKEDRGLDKWERISWEEAMDIFAEALKANQEKYGYEGSCLFNGTGRAACIHAALGCYSVLQSPNQCYALSGWSCYGPRCAVVNFVAGAGIPEMDYAAGFPLRYDDPSFQVPNYILVWGKEPPKSNSDGLFGHALIELMRLGAKLITVDPRMTWLATRSHLALRLRPGTDAALAMGILNVIINEDLYDHDFVDKWCYGFEQLAERVQEYPVEKVAEITEVPAEKIIEAGRALAQSPSSMTWGLSVDEAPNGVQTGQALMAIMAITGNLDIPGGTILGPVAGLGGAEEKDVPTQVPEDALPKKVGVDKYPAVGMIQNTVHPDLFLECLETDDPYPVRFAWLQSSNLISPTCSAQPSRWHKALQKMDFVVATDTFMNPTIMAVGDLFLPVATFAEGDGVVFTHFGSNTTNCSAINKAITVGEAKSDPEICFMLAKRIFPDIYTASVDELVHGYLSGLGAMSGAQNWYELRDIGTAQVPVTYKKYEKGLLRADGKPGFSTPTGRVELWTTMYRNLGDDPLPYYFEPKMSPSNTPEYEFILTTGSRRVTSFHSEHRQIKNLRDIHPNPVLEMNPADAKKHGIEEGDWVRIVNEHGSARYKVEITPILKKGVVNAAHGWWFPEEDPNEPNLYGVWKSNVNNMIPHGDIGKIGFGAPFKSAMCNIEKAE